MIEPNSTTANTCNGTAINGTLIIYSTGTTPDSTAPTCKAVVTSLLTNEMVEYPLCVSQYDGFNVNDCGAYFSDYDS